MGPCARSRATASCTHSAHCERRQLTRVCIHACQSTFWGCSFDWLASVATVASLAHKPMLSSCARRLQRRRRRRRSRRRSRGGRAYSPQQPETRARNATRPSDDAYAPPPPPPTYAPRPMERSVVVYRSIGFGPLIWRRPLARASGQMRSTQQSPNEPQRSCPKRLSGPTDCATIGSLCAETRLYSPRLVLLQSAVCGLGRCSVASERSTMANGASNSQASRAARHKST